MIKINYKKLSFRNQQMLETTIEDELSRKIGRNNYIHYLGLKEFLCRHPQVKEIEIENPGPQYNDIISTLEPIGYEVKCTCDISKPNKVDSLLSEIKGLGDDDLKTLLLELIRWL